MAIRVAYLFEKNLGFSFRELERDLGSAGLSVLEPSSGLVVSLDTLGSSSLKPYEVFLHEATHAPIVRFEWYFDKLANIYCLIKVCDDLRIIKLGLEGSNRQERMRIALALEKRFIQEPSRSVGLVFDPEGYSEDYDWSSLFQFGETLDWQANGFETPMMIGLRHEDLDKVKNLPEPLKIRRFGQLCVLSTDEVPIV